MKYELAKELKDAGFPQESTWTDDNQMPSRYYEHAGMDIRYRHIENEEGVKMPTLSELIEACGDSFMMLSSPKYKLGPTGKWKADNDDFVGMGDSPEEAVARLWIAINKKP